MDKSLLDQWNKLAVNDLKVSKILLRENQLLLSMFHLQQTTEKYLKMYFIAKKNGQPPYVHNLIRIAEVSDLLVTIDENHRDLLNALNPFYITTRYPAYKNNLESTLTSDKVKDYIERTEEFISWLKQLMKY
ncbi:MAG: HEPN domain-containing protein [Oligoflexia bacterium]|nr:HEPN domain-containing protein [Oligoflexia bacterium]